MRIKRLFRNIEIYLFFVIILFGFLVEARSGQFFSGNNIVDLIRSFTIPAMFCIGEMMVLISGDTDVSFPAVASMSMFISCYELGKTVNSPIMYFAVAMLIGIVIGAFNGFIISYFKFPGLIVTLGTSSICFGIMQGVFHAREYPLPDSLLRVGKAKILTAANSQLGLSSDLPTVTVIMVLLLIFGWFVMNKTMLGRGIYAIGGDKIAARRAGFNVFWIRMFCYIFSGCMAGMIGVLRATMLQAIHPTNLTGMELTVIAACVLGGVKITGGKGTVLGAALGMALLTITSNSLILLGIDMKWQNVFVGVLIITGTAISSIQTQGSKRQLSVKLKET
jgi:simple sugar transport system permease protein